MPLQNNFIQFITSRKLFLKENRLLVAVSGGLDSVVLAHLCASAGFNVSVAHVNFCLRGEESDGDELFVKQLAEKMQAPFFGKRLNAEKYATEKGLSIQVAARELRYAFFHQLIDDGKADKILTAHHADDNAETMLMHFFQGAGIEGLRGIPVTNGKVIRPLLFAPRAALEEYVDEHQLQWREDSTNLTDKYTRNQIRHQLIPAIEKTFPHFRKSFYDQADRFAEIESIYHAAITRALNKMIRKESDAQMISIGALMGSGIQKSLVYEWLKPYGFSPGESAAVLKLVNSEAGRFVASGSYTVLRHRNNLVLSPQQPTTTGYYVWSDLTVPLNLPGQQLLAEVVDNPVVSPQPDEAWLDAANFKQPVVVRRWKSGDYFYPLGMRKKKKLSDFFTDIKLSIFEKDQIWIVESGDRIAWVAGMRIDDRFKITPSTRKAVRLRLVSKQ